MILIETYHWDIEGSKRLEYLLDKYSPKTMCIEFPENLSLKEFEKQKKIVVDKRTLEINKTDLPLNFKKILAETINSSGYELFVAVEYSKRTKAKLSFIEHPSLYSELKSGFEGEEDNFLKAILSELTQEDIEKAEAMSYEKYRKKFIAASDELFYKNAIFTIENIPSYTQEANDKFKAIALTEKREQFMAEKLIRINPDIHIGGRLHLSEELRKYHPVTPLYQRFGDLVTKKIRLCDAFKE
jgi:hypothetical protein